jgi:hypothetical protein
MLQAAAQRGVRVNILVYKEVTQALTCTYLLSGAAARSSFFPISFLFILFILLNVVTESFCNIYIHEDSETELLIAPLNYQCHLLTQNTPWRVCTQILPYFGTQITCLMV